MSEVTTAKRIILDKSFLQSENQAGDRLRLLHDCGAFFVMTDTLIYELCTDANAGQWPATQRKLFPFADRLEVWWHVSDLLKHEIANQRPVESPISWEVTERVREWFRGGRVYVPPNLPTLGKPAKQEREVDTVESVIKSCQAICRVNPEFTKRIQRAGMKDDGFLRDTMLDEELLKWWVKNYHGNPEDLELYIKGAENGLGPEWFAHQNARRGMVLCCHFMSKYGLQNTPGKDFTHTKLDSDYVALLHYADALATNETSGSLASICRWMHGNSKIIFSTSKLDAARPNDEQIQLEAFFKWQREGERHGDDWSDWLWAKSHILWKQLNPNS